MIQPLNSIEFHCNGLGRVTVGDTQWQDVHRIGCRPGPETRSSRVTLAADRERNEGEEREKNEKANDEQIETRIKSRMEPNGSLLNRRR